jgi:hypothetical protein
VGGGGVWLVTARRCPPSEPIARRRAQSLGTRCATVQAGKSYASAREALLLNGKFVMGTLRLLEASDGAFSFSGLAFVTALQQEVCCPPPPSLSLSHPHTALHQRQSTAHAE